MTDRIEPFRGYLRVLARAQLGEALRARVDPSDVVQETMMQATKDLPGFAGDGEQLRHWLAKILRNNVVDVARHHGCARRDVHLERSLDAAGEGSTANLRRCVAQSSPSPPSDAELLELTLTLASAVDALPDRQRTAIELHHLGGLTLRESAQMMNVSPSAAAGLMHRGMLALREALA